MIYRVTSDVCSRSKLRPVHTISRPKETLLFVPMAPFGVHHDKRTATAPLCYSRPWELCKIGFHYVLYGPIEAIRTSIYSCQIVPENKLCARPQNSVDNPAGLEILPLERGATVRTSTGERLRILWVCVIDVRGYKNSVLLALPCIPEPHPWSYTGATIVFPAGATLFSRSPSPKIKKFPPWGEAP